MSPAYPHLLLNHLPVVVSLVAAVLLAVAVWKRTLISAQYGLYAQIAVALLAIFAYVSGNFAPPALDHVAGAATDRITFHQVSAAASMISSILLGLLCSVPLVFTELTEKRGVVIAYLVLSLGLVALFAFTASTGGAIRHTELSALS
jgi:uncharacterized membrane protein